MVIADARISCTGRALKGFGRDAPREYVWETSRIFLWIFDVSALHLESMDVYGVWMTGFRLLQSVVL